MFERIDYIVKQIDGDYAYLERLEKPEGQEDELKCVARALLPPEIMAACRRAAGWPCSRPPCPGQRF